MPSMPTSTSILFVCLGNICRSPTAHAVFRHLAEHAGLSVMVDSAGTIAEHQGEPPDPRTRKAGEARGIDFSGIYSRPVTTQDFYDFDVIYAMDKSNLANLQRMQPTDSTATISLFLSLDPASPVDEVPDPYYGGPQGFETVIDLVTAASEHLVRQLSAASDYK